MKATYPKLPKKFKEKWLIALRSGEYMQTKKTLKDEDGFCCLGLACEISGHSKTLAMYHDAVIEPKRYKNIPSMIKGNGEMGSLIEKLTRMNDGSLLMKTKPKSFKQIANWIQKNL